MNKLEVLYKMSKVMKEKKNVKGCVKILGKSTEGEFVNITNKFEKDIENRKMKIDANIKVNTEEVQVAKQIIKELDFDKMHKGYMHHKGCKGNKFEKLEMLFKTLNDMELTEQGENKIITLDAKEMLEKKVNKIREMHKIAKENNECKHKECECEEFKQMFKVKHAVMKEICGANYEKVMLKLTIDKGFNIKEVNIHGTGEKEVTFNVELNY